jgi:hypothetical protein
MELQGYGVFFLYRTVGMPKTFLRCIFRLLVHYWRAQQRKNIFEKMRRPTKQATVEIGTIGSEEDLSLGDWKN